MLKPGTLYQGDCLKLLPQINDESIDLAFADPPFNIDFKYDEYHDKQNDQEYLAWCTEWLTELHRVTKSHGTFWLAIGDEYAAELKFIATRMIPQRFIMRSWIIWYYTFGVNCTKKFNRSHVHLFQFIKDAKRFTFNSEDPLIRVPSARALIYNDKRANPKGRLPDDTWILRPQDIPESFQPMDDTWHCNRVAGTFKERQGFHGCQMPEQILGRIIRISSNENDTILDPFTGSGTTLTVAKKLNRNYIGIELSDNYVYHATKRINAANVGDPLNGTI